MTTPQAHTPTRIAELDGWRGISILFVVFGHLFNLRYGALIGASLPNFAYVLAEWGVDIFFVISGFIITKLAFAEQRQTKRFSIVSFYVRRCFRIIPPYYLYLCVVVGLSLKGLIAQNWSGVLPAAAFACNFPALLDRCGWFFGHSWTLAFEEQFYLLFPIIFLLSRKSVRKVLLSIFAALLAFPFLRLAAHFGTASMTAMAISFSFIATGAVVAAYEEEFQKIRLSSHGVYVSCFASGVLLGLLIFNGAFALPLGSSSSYIRAALNIILLPTAMAWIVLGYSYREGPLTGLLRNRGLQFIGLISYSLYLWQEAFTAEPQNYLVRSWLEFPPLMLVVATGSYYCLERPCIRLGKRVLTILRSARREVPAAVAEG